MAMGRIPPDFLVRAISEPPKMIVATSSWHFPSRSRLVKAVIDESKPVPISLHVARFSMRVGAAHPDRLTNLREGSDCLNDVNFCDL